MEAFDLTCSTYLSWLAQDNIGSYSWPFRSVHFRRRYLVVHFQHRIKNYYELACRFSNTYWANKMLWSSLLLQEVVKVYPSLRHPGNHWEDCPLRCSANEEPGEELAGRDCSGPAGSQTLNPARLMMESLLHYPC